MEECLRFDAPLHLFTRYALSDLEYEGLQLRKGDVIGLMLGAANRDPERFANANRFDPFRTDGANVSFGAGIHFCIGAPLARIELQVAFSELFRRLPRLKLAAEPRYNDVYHFHGLERLMSAGEGREGSRDQVGQVLGDQAGPPNRFAASAWSHTAARRLPSRPCPARETPRDPGQHVAGAGGAEPGGALALMAARPSGRR